MSQFKGITREDVIWLLKQYDDPHNKMTQEDMAQELGVAPVTIRRLLAENGRIELKNYLTEDKELMLKELRSYGITTPKKLKVLLRAITTDKATGKPNLSYGR